MTKPVIVWLLYKQVDKYKLHFRSLVLTTVNRKMIAKFLSLGCLGLIVTACSQTNPASIKDISNSPSNNTSRTTSSVSSDSTYNTPPANITRQNTSYQSPSSVTTTSSRITENNGVTTTQERIVYNRNYDAIPKGGYKGDSYTVQKGDTLFYIAWITGNDFRSLAAKNNIKEPYELSVGQTLDVGGSTVVVTEKTTSTGSTSTQQKQTVTTTTTNNNKPNTVKTTTTTTSTTGATAATTASAASSTVANINWQWPTNGKVIETFSNATKGIDISGSLGDKIVSAADGRVVYAGNALPGYGNLIIIKHNDDYLTAYAHNQSILVKEQQAIKAGEQIATMGSTGTTSVRLHFEIRYKAQSVDPLKYLPKK